MIAPLLQDFVLELTTWFRRAIWFLGFTAATTASVPLFLVTAALAAVFELVYNVTNARAYWEAVHQYGAQGGWHRPDTASRQMGTCCGETRTFYLDI